MWRHSKNKLIVFIVGLSLFQNNTKTRPCADEYLQIINWKMDESAGHWSCVLEIYFHFCDIFSHRKVHVPISALHLLVGSAWTCQPQLSFSQTYYVTTKNCSNKMLLQLALNPGPQPSRSTALLSELWRHVLLGISSNCLWFLHHFNLGLRSFLAPIEHDHMKILDLSSRTCVNRLENKASDPNGWDPGFNTHSGNNLLLDFSFHLVKPVMQILPFLSISANLWKTRSLVAQNITKIKKNSSTENFFHSFCVHFFHSRCVWKDILNFVCLYLSLVWSWQPWWGFLIMADTQDGCKYYNLSHGG